VAAVSEPVAPVRRGHLGEPRDTRAISIWPSRRLDVSCIGVCGQFRYGATMSGKPPAASQASVSAAATGSRDPLIVLRAAWLFDGISSALIPDPVVVIDGATIRAVSSGGIAPRGAAVIELAGATLLPGLVDTHVHLAFDASADPVGSLVRRDDADVVEAMTRAGQAALHGGVTTVRDLGDRGYLSLELRGRPGLPTIVAAGPPITTPGGHCHYLGGATAPTVDGVRVAVREHAAQGVDVIKIMASGGNLTPGSRQDLAQFPSDVLRAAVDEAHWLGLQVTVHAHAVAAIADAVAAGVDGLEHATFWTEDGVDAPAHLIRMIAGQQIAVGPRWALCRCRAWRDRHPQWPPGCLALSRSRSGSMRLGRAWSPGPMPASRR
jgi:imidazolonepropionase-like amidohydrolase